VIPKYSVYRGPGNRLICISQEPVKNEWIVKSGEQGKRLRSATIPLSKHASFESVWSSHVGADYELQFTGRIDASGNPTDDSSQIIYWEAKSITASECCSFLRKAALDLQSHGVALTLTDDLSGTCVQIGQAKFGVMRSAGPGSVDFDGNGAGMLSIHSSADLLCLCAMASRSLPISFAAADGKKLTRSEVVNLCISNSSDGMSEYLETQGFTSLITTLRKLSAGQAWF